MSSQESGEQLSVRGGLIARLSLEHKLPLIMGGLAVMTIIAVATAAYVEVRRSSLQTASDRLTSVTGQFRDLFQTSARQLRTQVATTAGKPALAAYAKSRAAGLRDRALDALKYSGSNADQVLAVELRDSTGRTLLSTNDAGRQTDTIAVSDVLPRTEPGDSALVGRFRTIGDTMIYPVAAAVPGDANAYVVQWRRIAGSRRSREQINQLIGSNASLFLGNPHGTHWTNLERPVPAPPIDPESSDPVQRYSRDGVRHLAAASRIPGTPWLVAVDFPMRYVMRPVDAFVSRIAFIAALALALALAAAWFMSRRITAPLREVTDAATAIAAGDYTRHPDIRRHDELGRLGAAFGTMATEVQHAREGLERKVEERTGELNQTLVQLRDAQESLVRREKLAMLGQLASGVGHELRNPLGVMTNAVYFLKMVLAAQPQNVLEYLDILQQQITLSEKIVGDLLDFARLKQPQRVPVHLQEVTSAQLGRLGATNGAEIVTDIPSRLPAVLADQVQIGQIVLNLLTNALQAIEGPGRITIRAQAAGDRVHYDVTDTGPGVAPENLDKIFEPLFTTKARGIGLGLAVSRTLARANSGDLNVKSTPGNGATFRLTLPVATERTS